MKEFIKKCFSSDKGVSSKRVISISAFLLLTIAFISNLFFNLIVVQYMYDTMSYIVIAGLGFTASEFFAGVKKVKPNDENEEE